MPRSLTEQEREEFLAEPRVAVLSVASDGDRPPHTVPSWYAYEPGGNVSFFTGTQGQRARKSRLIESAGKLSVSVQHPEWPYRYVTVEGTVVAVDSPPTAEQMLAILLRYLPEAEAQGFVEGELAEPSDTLTLYTVRPDRWLTYDFGEAA